MQRDARMLAEEVIHGPLVGEKNHQLPADVAGQLHAVAEVVIEELALRDLGPEPANLRKWRGLQSRFGAILVLKAVHHHLELQLPDGPEQRRLPRVDQREGLDHALIQQLLQSLAELLVFGRAGIADVREGLRGKPGNLVVPDRRICGERVADAECPVGDQAYDVAGIRLVQRLAVLRKQLLRIRKPDRLAGDRVVDHHVLDEPARTHAHKREAVAMPGIHVRLNLEYETREVGIGRRHQPLRGIPRLRRRAVLDEILQQQFHPEVRHGAAEKHGSDQAGHDVFLVEHLARPGQHFHFLHPGPVKILRHIFSDVFVTDAADMAGGAVLPVRGALEQVQMLLQPIVDPAKRLAAAQRPGDRKGADSQDLLQLVQKVQRIARRPVHLVHERENRDAAHPADFEQFPGPLLDALGGVDDHDDAVHGGQHPVCVLAEILVTGGVEQVDDTSAVFELKQRGRDGNTALFFQLHPVRGGRALVPARAHGPRQLNRPAVQQQLFRQRGLPGVGMRNNGECTPSRNFLVKDFVGHGARRVSKKGPGCQPTPAFHLRQSSGGQPGRVESTTGSTAISAEYGSTAATCCSWNRRF